MIGVRTVTACNDGTSQCPFDNSLAERGRRRDVWSLKDEGWKEEEEEEEEEEDKYLFFGKFEPPASL